MKNKDIPKKSKSVELASQYVIASQFLYSI